MSTPIMPHPGQLFRSKIQETIDRKDVMSYDIHYRIIETDGHKSNVYLSDHDELSIDAFIDTANNYGSFWLSLLYQDETTEMFQVISDTTGEPL